MTASALSQLIKGMLLLLLTVSLYGPVVAEEAPARGSRPVSEVIFVAFDTETTGLKAAEGRILEIGAVKFLNRRIVDKKSWLINPGIPIPEGSQRIHGITPAMVSNGPPFSVVFRDFAAFTTGAVLLAHNAHFDRRFMVAEMARNGLTPLDNPLLDTLPLYRAWFPGLTTYALEELTRTLLPVESEAARTAVPANRTRRFHSALWDAECTTALFMKGQANLPETATLAEVIQAARKVLSFSPQRPQPRPSLPLRTGTNRGEPAQQTPQTEPPARSGKPSSVAPPPASR
jgi:DNA polymerase III epsilon subunit family exonuclease